MAVETRLRVARYVSLVAATIISLACGTNYAYSAWGPEFAEDMQLTATQSNMIATAGNWGMYLLGIPLGKFVDTAGARFGALLGAGLIGGGYGGLRYIYVHDMRNTSVAVYCVLSALTGAGGCVAFLGSMKTAAVNFPTHRGSATAFPLAAFGLSAFFFSALSHAFSDDAKEFLWIVLLGTIVMTTAPVLFLRTSPPPTLYSSVPAEAPRATRLDSRSRLKSKSEELSRKREAPLGSGTQYAAVDGTSSSSSARSRSLERPAVDKDENLNQDVESNAESTEEPVKNQAEARSPAHHSLYADVRGFAMLKYSECYELFFLMGIMTGIGLMTINNIGEDAKALWIAYDHNTEPNHIRTIQRFHVSILSICSFLGRLLGGIGSDVIVKRLHSSRFWCLFASTCVFASSQAIALTLDNPRFLFFLSGTTGVAYGILFGVCPSLIADTFGTGGLSQNWGLMTLGPAFFGELFTFIYGKTLDSHSKEEGGKLTCYQGKHCYRTAYIVTLISSWVAMAVVLWCVQHRQMTERRLQKQDEEADDDHVE